MRWLEDLQRTIESLLHDDMQIYLLIGGVLLLLAVIVYGLYLLLVNVIVPLF